MRSIARMTMRGLTLRLPQPPNLILIQMSRLNVCPPLTPEYDACHPLTVIYTDLLAPLTAASDLPDHPTLSKPFTSKTLTELTRQAGDMVHKEKASLWRIKHLLTKLSGDHTWIPCEIVETEQDIALFGDDRDRHHGRRLGKPTAKDDGSTSTSISDEAVQQAGLLLEETENNAETAPGATKEIGETPALEVDVDMEANNQIPDIVGGLNEGDNTDIQTRDERLQDLKATTDTDIRAEIDGLVAVEDAATAAEPQIPESKDNQEPEGMELTNTDEGMEEEDTPAPSRMRTRAQAQAASDNTTTSRSGSATPDSSTESFIHPYFLAPRSSHPDRDLGLPKQEAEETRKLLQLYIQKQEEVCRGAQRVYDGLLKADRYRRLVMKWAKAEAHVGPNRDMSDGEDWYDKEEWGLEEDLKKGQDEDEEDAVTTAKKTRTRRQ